jgi:MFS family permease
MLAIALGFACANGAISSVQPDYFARLFGTNIRYSGISIGREGATIIGGGLSPVIATALVTATGASWPVALCMMFTSVIGFAVVLFARREDKAVGASIDQIEPDPNRALPRRPR